MFSKWTEILGKSLQIKELLYCAMSWIVALQKMMKLRKLSMTLLGIKVFADENKVKDLEMRLSWSEWAPNPMTSPYSRRKVETEKRAEASKDRGRDRSYKAASQGIPDCQHPPEARILPHCLQKGSTPLTSWFWISCLHNCERIHFYLKPPSFW